MIDCLYRYIVANNILNVYTIGPAHGILVRGCITAAGSEGSAIAFRIRQVYILMGFKNATLTSRYDFQKTVECKHPLLRWCHHEVASSVNTFKVLIVQLNSTMLLICKVFVNETFLK